MKISYPTLKGKNDSEKIEELRKYLMLLVDEVSFAIESIDNRVLKNEKNKEKK